MRKIAEDVYQIPLFPRHAVNAYLIGTVLIDAGIRSSAPKILNALVGHEVTAHALTHAHADHQGASAHICTTLNIPYWCGEGDKAAAESGDIANEYSDPNHPLARLQQRFWVGPGHPVAKTLHEGDQIGEFVVLETPGHSAGHVVFWRERDGVLIAGDVINNMNMLTTIPGVSEPPAIFTPDVPTNRQSIKKIAALQPRIVCVGHGPPLRDPAALIALANKL